MSNINIPFSRTFTNTFTFVKAITIAKIQLDDVTPENEPEMYAKLLDYADYTGSEELRYFLKIDGKIFDSRDIRGIGVCNPLWVKYTMGITAMFPNEGWSNGMRFYAMVNSDRDEILFHEWLITHSDT